MDVNSVKFFIYTRIILNKGFPPFSSESVVDLLGESVEKKGKGYTLRDVKNLSEFLGYLLTTQVNFIFCQKRWGFAFKIAWKKAVCMYLD